jgi:nicotinate-nucleotide adenylyltransferase
MRIGVYGGSFDPVHLGHLRLADCCWKQARLDCIEFMPTAQQPLKPQGPVASEHDRVAMLRLAIAERPEFSVSTIEVDRGGVSYTVDTLRALHHSRPGARLFFLMGADALAEFPQWREPDVICELAMPLIVHRAGSPEPDFAALRSIVSAERLAEIRAAQVEMPPMPISSTAVRELIASGGRWQSLVPTTVAEYIAEHKLYWNATALC